MPSGIYFGGQPTCPSCKEVTAFEFMKRSRFTGAILCDRCVPFDIYSNEWNYYAEGHDELAGFPVENGDDN